MPLSYDSQTEQPHAAEFLGPEANGERGREEATLISGQDLKAGAVLGKITVGGKYTEHDKDASDGSEVAVAVLFDAMDASGGDETVVIVARDSIVTAASLQWPAGYVQGDKDAAIAELKAVGIIAR